MLARFREIREKLDDTQENIEYWDRLFSAPFKSIVFYDRDDFWNFLNLNDTICVVKRLKRTFEDTRVYMDHDCWNLMTAFYFPILNNSYQVKLGLDSLYIGIRKISDLETEDETCLSRLLEKARSVPEFGLYELERATCGSYISRHNFGNDIEYRGTRYKRVAFCHPGIIAHHNTYLNFDFCFETPPKIDFFVEIWYLRGENLDYLRNGTFRMLCTEGLKDWVLVTQGKAFCWLDQYSKSSGTTEGIVSRNIPV